MLTIQLFGEFQCYHAGQPVRALYAPRVRALLAYLLLHRSTSIARQQVARHFWPAAGETQARTNLRNLLAQLRAALPEADHYLHSDRQSVHWRAAAAYTLDVAEFQAALARARHATAPSTARHQLETALQLYWGELLPSADDPWLAPIRTDLRHSYGQGLTDLTELLLRQGDYQSALAPAQQLLQLDPLREASYARLMQIYTALGKRAAALWVYHSCVATLRRAVGIEPAATTRQRYEQLLNLEQAELPTHQLPTPTALIGREGAWAQVQAAWQRASRGQPLFLLIQGEAGVGKTHLAAALLAWVQQQGDLAVSAQCYSVAGQLALAPVVAWLRTPALQPALAALDAVRLAALAGYLPEVVTPSAPALPLSPDHDPRSRRRLFALLARLFSGKATPRLLLLDDLQWCDQTTLEWLPLLLRFSRRAPLLVVATLRRAAETTATPLTNLLTHLHSTGAVAEVSLAPLDPTATAQLAVTLSGRPLTKDETDALFAQTAGNPLCLVETICAHVTGQAPLPTRAPLLPPNVPLLIQRRLVRLSATARRLVDVAAVIGRAFTLDELALAAEQGEDALILGLDELWQQQIVQSQGAATYAFRHDLVRDVALAAISPAWRRLLHQRVAAALATLYADQLDEVSGQLAHHYAASNQVDQAILSYQRAAQVALRRAAVDDALAALQGARQLLGRLGDEERRQQLDLTLQAALAPLLPARRP